ncbi:MAG: phosphotransferase family protein [Acidimicrobiia bacterium]|nr:phosphotransferase family protein [Acidimicrobiia bacterium]
MTALADDLQGWVTSETGGSVVDAARLGKGASRRTWAVDLDDGRSVVVREDTGSGPVAGTPLTLSREADVYRALAPARVPMPRLLATSPDGRALLFERAPGTDELASASDDERISVACDYGRALGRLHDLPVTELELGSVAVAAGDDPTATDIALWQSIREARCGSGETPVSAPALDWLAHHVPGGGATTSLCHGDAGPGNFLHQGGAVTALLDWEFAHIGNPHDDLAWVGVRNQLLGRPLALGNVYAGWREASGSGLALDRLEYYRVLVLVRMAVSCDAALNWSGGETTADMRVQAALRPFLAPAILEALRRAGCDEPFVDELAGPARAEWERSPIAAVLGDPSDLDDLGKAL